MARILCIEDDAETRILLRKSLENAGLQVDAVWNGEKGVQAAMSGSFDCVILDLMMPGMDGFQVIQTLKTQGLTSKLPLMVVTARTDNASRQRALAAGADAYMVKPFDLTELVGNIHKLLDGQPVDSPA